jgi:hypothetical protein
MFGHPARPCELPLRDLFPKTSPAKAGPLSGIFLAAQARVSSRSTFEELVLKTGSGDWVRPAFSGRELSGHESSGIRFSADRYLRAHQRVGRLIGKGSAVTRRPLPHHRAYGSGRLRIAASTVQSRVTTKMPDCRSWPRSLIILCLLGTPRLVSSCAGLNTVPWPCRGW